MKEVKIITQNKKEILEVKIAEFLNDGWELKGFSAYQTTLYFWYSAILVKEVED